MSSPFSSLCPVREARRRALTPGAGSGTGTATLAPARGASASARWRINQGAIRMQGRSPARGKDDGTISLIFPTYNPGPRLEATWSAVCDFVVQAPGQWEVL